MAKVLNKILDLAIISAAAIALVVAMSTPRATTEGAKDMVHDATKAPTVTTVTTVQTVPETTEPTQEPTQDTTEATQPTTMATESTEAMAETLPPETEAPITLYDVPLATDLQLHIISEAETNGIEPAIIFAMAYRESGYNASAIGDGGDSLGLLQVQPYWHSERMERLGCPDLLDPFQNVTLGVNYLAELLGRYGSIEAALVGYNRGHYSGTVTEYAWTVLAIAEELRGTTYESYKHNTGPQS